MSHKITGEIKISETKEQEIQGIGGVSDYKEKIERYLASPATEILEMILGGAIKLDASDVHLEPEEESVKIRIRIDGLLQEVITVTPEVYKKLLSRIKLLSALKLNISDRPQDGRFSIVLENTTIEIRTSALPAENGETIVLRILNPQSLIELEALGFRKDLLKIVEKEIKRPHGMIVVTGPTGSGKTTTLYAFCREIRKPENKIITIEDPIEYHLEGISQTQVSPKKGYDFASGLKSIMRQDPDIILVGEMRDTETVNTALQAALTGHLVLTTLHTNDAAGAVARLTSLGGMLSNIGPAVNLIIAQRLTRKVCPECKKFERVTPEELKKLKEELSHLKLDIPRLSEETKIPKAVGCPLCNFTGYKGRFGVFEIFSVNDKVEKFILSEHSIAALRELAIKEGMITIKQDGLIKVLEGSTTLEEVERIVGE